jgi:hypothetical protein
MNKIRKKINQDDNASYQSGKTTTINESENVMIVLTKDSDDLFKESSRSFIDDFFLTRIYLLIF